jgi:hypothetical protein
MQLLALLLLRCCFIRFVMQQHPLRWNLQSSLVRAVTGAVPVLLLLRATPSSITNCCCCCCCCCSSLYLARTPAINTCTPTSTAVAASAISPSKMLLLLQLLLVLEMLLRQPILLLVPVLLLQQIIMLLNLRLPNAALLQRAMMSKDCSSMLQIFLQPWQQLGTNSS